MYVCLHRNHCWKCQWWTHHHGQWPSCRSGCTVQICYSTAMCNLLSPWIYSPFSWRLSVTTLMLMRSFTLPVKVRLWWQYPIPYCDCFIVMSICFYLQLTECQEMDCTNECVSTTRPGEEGYQWMYSSRHKPPQVTDNVYYNDIEVLWADTY